MSKKRNLSNKLDETEIEIESKSSETVESSLEQSDSLKSNLKKKPKTNKAESSYLKHGSSKIDFVSLLQFKKIHGHMVIPRSFTFPEDSIDGEPLGFAARYLGRHVREIRAKKDDHSDEILDKLKEMGFIWRELDRRLDELANNLNVYKSIYGNYAVPRYFIIPQDDDRWNKISWGKKLGRQITVLLNDDRLLKLKERGIDMQFLIDESAQNVILALETYKINNFTGNDQDNELHVPYRFMIPEGDSAWPTSTWGMKLGYIVNNIRHQGCYPNYHDKFEQLGISFRTHFGTQANKIELALRTYKSIYHTDNSSEELCIPTKFKIPDADPAWPSSIWGMSLGGVVSDIRLKGAYADYHDRFKEIGLSFKRYINRKGERSVLKNGRT